QNGISWWTDPRPAGTPNDFEVGQYKIKSFLCPSNGNDADPAPAVPGGPSGAIVGHRYWDSNLSSIILGSSAFGLGRTNYAGVAGVLGANATVNIGSGSNIRPASRYEGILTNRSRITLVSVRDGLSNTLMFGEGLGGRGDTTNFFWSWVGV